MEIKSVDPEAVQQKVQETKAAHQQSLVKRKAEQLKESRASCLFQLEEMNRNFSSFQNDLMRILPMDKCQTLSEVIGLFDTAILEATQLVPSEKELAAHE